MKTKRLSPDDWITAGFHALAKDGPIALKAEPLARRLGTTKGSFYWHFADVPGFHVAMLSHWETRAFDDIVNALAQEPSPVQRLRQFGQAMTAAASNDHGGIGTEPAIRAWGRSCPLATAAILSIDAKRIALLQELLNQLDLSNPELCRILYGGLLGMTELSAHDGADNTQPMATLVDLILALYE